MSLNENKLEVNPTLEIDNSKDIKSLKSIITEIKRIGKNATINISQNQDMSDKEKYLTLWEENNKLNAIINSLITKLSELEKKQELYSSFLINYYPSIEIFHKFLKELQENNIKFEKELKITKKSTQKGLLTIGNTNIYDWIYIVNNKNIDKFLEITSKYKIEIS